MVHRACKGQGRLERRFELERNGRAARTPSCCSKRARSRAFAFSCAEAEEPFHWKMASSQSMMNTSPEFMLVRLSRICRTTKEGGEPLICSSTGSRDSPLVSTWLKPDATPPFKYRTPLGK